MEKRTLSVLYTDDEDHLLQIGKLFLERFGNLKVETAISASVALTLLSQQWFDAIISDYQMPEMDGIEFLQEVRKQYPNIPFILFTGRGREEVVIQAINNGADFYLQKGGEPKSQFAELEHKIRQAVSRRDAENALVESERTSRALLNATTDAVVLINPDLSIVSVNDAFAHRFNLGPDALIGKHLNNLTPGEIHDIRMVKIGEVLSSKNGVRFEDQRDDLSLENSIYPIFDEKGNVVRLALYSRDITEKKRAEYELQQAYEQIAADEEELREKYEELAVSEQVARNNEERFRTLTESSLDTIMLFDKNLRHIYVNPNAEKQAGIPVQAFTGKTHKELGFPPNLIQIWDTALKEVFETGFTKRVEFQLPLGAWIDWQVVPIFGPDGQVEQVITSARDITERKESEQKIRLAEFSVNHSGLPTLWLDNTGKVYRANKAVCEALGYSPEEIVKLFVSDFDPFYPPEAWVPIWQKIKDSKYVVIESIHQRKDGSTFPVEISNSYFEYEGQELSFSFIHDISARKRAEDEIRAAYEEIAASEETLQNNYHALLLSEARFRGLFDQALQLIAVLDPEGRMVMVNQAALDIIGAVEKDLLNIHFWEAPWWEHDPGMAERVKDAVLRARNGELVRFEIIIHTIHKGAIFLDFSVKPIHDESGQIIALLPEGRDLTDLKKAESNLIKSRENLRLFFNHSPAAIFVHDLEGRIVDVNDTMCRMYRVAYDDALRYTIADYTGPDNSPVEAHEHWMKVIAGEDQEFEWQARRPVDNSLFDVLVYLTRISGEEGSLILGYVSDITIKKRTEMALEKERAFIQLLHETSPAFFVAIDSNGKTLMMNQTLLNTLEYRLEEVIGKNYLETFVPRADQQELAGVFNSIIHDRDVTRNENHIVSKLGKEYLVEWHGRFVEGIGRESDFFVGVGIDITDRKKIELALLESEERYRNLVETTGTGYVVLDIAGRVLEANAEYVHLTGRDSLHEIIGKSVSEWTAPSDMQVNAEEVAKCLEKGYTRDLEINYIHPNGTILPLEINASVMQSESGVRILTLCRDISSRKARMEKICRSFGSDE